MSDTSDESENPVNKEENLCRDYLRGFCDRKFCKYKHENEMRVLNFCHDYQNNICTRSTCKFVHCTPEEEIEYKRTGTMSTAILAEATRKSQLPGTPPICNQFRKGICRRNYCKYRHLTKEEEESEILEIIQNNVKKTFLNNLNNSCGNLYKRHFEDYEDCSFPMPKRRFLSSDDYGSNHHNSDENSNIRQILKRFYPGNGPSPMLSPLNARTLILEEEIRFLHKEISQLKRQVSDLTATNEFLLDQNANLRVGNKHQENVSAVPAVTITNTNTPQVIRTVTASVATVPVSLATVSTCNPVSVSIAGCPTVSMAPTGQILAPSQQILVTTNPTTQLAIANSSQAQLAIAQQNLANNLAAQQAQPQLTSQAQQLALATTTQQLALANQSQQLTNQSQQTHQQLTSQAQQLALASSTQQLTSSQAQQLALANTTLSSQAQQLAMANTSQHLAVTSVPQQLALANTNQQLLAQQNLTNNQQIEMHRNNQMNAINTSQAIAMSNATQPMVSYPIMTQQNINHALTH